MYFLERMSYEQNRQSCEIFMRLLLRYGSQTVMGYRMMQVKFDHRTMSVCLFGESDVPSANLH